MTEHEPFDVNDLAPYIAGMTSQDVPTPRTITDRQIYAVCQATGVVLQNAIARYHAETVRPLLDRIAALEGRTTEHQWHHRRPS